MSLQKNKGAVLITGSSTGLGYYLALGFAKRGHDILLHGRNVERLKNVQDEVLKLGVNADYFIGDLRRGDVLKNLSDFALKKEVRVLINNAGVTCPGEPLRDLGLQKIDDMIDTNLKAPIVLCKYLEDSLSDVINVNSMVGLEIKRFRTLYSASKWGLRGFSQSYKQEVEGVNVLDFYPTTMETWPGREMAMEIDFVIDNVYRAFEAKKQELILDGRKNEVIMR